MRSVERAALGRFVMRSKEYLVLIRPRDERLSLTTLLFHDEIRPAKGVPAGGKKPSKEQLDGAVKLIEAMAAEWEPAEYRDRYRARLREVVKSKKQGKRIKPPEREKEPAPVPDLMAALEKSLQEAQGRGGGRRGAARDDLDGLSREELYERAQEAGVEGRSQMSKKELVEALR
jgi:DNA end-binding protein Ku